MKRLFVFAVVSLTANCALLADRSQDYRTAALALNPVVYYTQTDRLKEF